jgi:hypothetical protein
MVSNVHIYHKNPFLILDYNSFLVSINQPKMFEMQFLKMVHLTFIVVFHLKIIVNQNVNLPHIVWSLPQKQFICDMIIIKLFIWLTNLIQQMESQCLIDITNFIKIKKIISSIHIAYLHFLVCCDIFFLVQIYSNITSYEIKKCSLFCVQIVWVLTYHNMQKHCESPS